MAISMAQQKGNYVYVYDEKNHQLYTQSGELQGYTSGTVTVKRDNYLYTYDEKGHQTAARAC